jgi:hypothetical protein
MLACVLLLIPIPATPDDLGRHAERYSGRIVYTETVLGDLVTDGRWRTLIEPEDASETLVTGEGRPDARKGDRVAIVGLFRYTDASFSRRVIRGARMQVIPFDVKPEQISTRGSPFDGRLVRTEGVVRTVDRDVFILGPKSLRVTWSGTPAVAKGDRVRVTGVCGIDKDSFLPGHIDVTKSGTVEKLGP